MAPRKKSDAKSPVASHPILELFATNEDKALVRDTLASNAEFRELADNVLGLQRDVFKRLLDPRRDYEAECGYANIAELKADDYKLMFDEESIATRVVEVYPKECWKVQPLVFEVEDEEEITEFERHRAEISQKLRGQSWFKKPIGDPIWEVCKRADIESGIGHYGAILIGVGDGKQLHEPVPGIDPRTGEKIKGDAPTNTQIILDEVSEPFGALFPMDNLPRYSPFVGNLSVSPPPPPIPSSSPATEPEAPSRNYRELLFLRVLNETNCKIVEVDQDESSPRHGQPVMYEVHLNKPEGGYVGPTTSYTTKKVHWTRIVHIVEGGDLFHTPRMRPVFHKLQNLHKLYGGSAEMYWRGAFPGLSIETHPALGPAPKIDEEKLRGSIWKYQNGLQRLLALVGMSAKSLAPQVVDPTNMVDVQITGVCIVLACPKRVFMGSERGELASDQDDDTWDERVRERQINHLIPNLVVKLHDRFILLDILPEPGENGYAAEWPDQKSLGEMEQAQVAVYRTEAMSKYVSGGVDALISPIDYLTRIIRFTADEAKEILEETTTYLEEQNPDAEQDIVAGRDPKPIIEPGVDPVTGDPVVPPSNGRPPGNGRKPPPIPAGRR